MPICCHQAILLTSPYDTRPPAPPHETPPPAAQTFAEKLFSRLQSCKEKWETRLALMCVISRVVGVHKLQLLNFYPLLQKYILPHQREVTQVLAALVQVSGSGDSTHLFLC